MAGKQAGHAGFAQHLVEVGRTKLKAEIRKQRHEFGLDKEGQDESASAAEAYAREKSKRRVKQGLERDPDAKLDWDVVKFVDRYGEEHFVSPAMAEKMQEEYEAELRLEEEAGLLPCPKPVRLAKQPSYNSFRVRVNWSPPNDFCHADEIKHAIVMVAGEQPTPRPSRYWLVRRPVCKRGRSRREHHDREEFRFGRKQQRIVKNKRARFVEIGDLHPNTDYEVRVSFRL